MSDNKFTRTGAGTWKLEGLGTPVTTQTPGTGVAPSPSAPSAPIRSQLSPPTPAVGVKPATGTNPAYPRSGNSGAFPATPVRSSGSGAFPATPQRSGNSGAFPAVSSSGSGVSSSSSSGVRTPSRGLPSDPTQRAGYMAAQARKDIEAERWAAAESNLLLAMTWDSGNGDYKMMLDEVRRIREDLRKNAPKKI